MSKRKPQSGIASFSMHELAELITKPIKHDKRTTKHVPAKRTASKNWRVKEREWVL